MDRTISKAGCENARLRTIDIYTELAGVTEGGGIEREEVKGLCPILMS
jgi:hypothetical protein